MKVQNHFVKDKNKMQCLRTDVWCQVELLSEYFFALNPSCAHSIYILKSEVSHNPTKILSMLLLYNKVCYFSSKDFLDHVAFITDIGLFLFTMFVRLY